MAENNITLYIGTAERKEQLHDVAKKGKYSSTSAMVQAIAKGEAVAVKVETLSDLLAGIREYGHNLPPYGEEAFEAVQALIGDDN